MKCVACDCILSDREATRRSLVTDEFVDLCDHCIQDTEIETNDCTLSEVQEDVDGIESE